MHAPGPPVWFRAPHGRGSLFSADAFRPREGSGQTWSNRVLSPSQIFLNYARYYGESFPFEPPETAYVPTKQLRYLDVDQVTNSATHHMCMPDPIFIKTGCGGAWTTHTGCVLIAFWRCVLCSTDVCMRTRLITQALLVTLLPLTGPAGCRLLLGRDAQADGHPRRRPRGRVWRQLRGRGRLMAEGVPARRLFRRDCLQVSVCAAKLSRMKRRQTQLFQHLIRCVPAVRSPGALGIQTQLHK